MAVPLTSGLSAGEYAFVEFYCEEPNCDCRRAFIQVIARHQADKVLASINCGWEAESFDRTREFPCRIYTGELELPRELRLRMYLIHVRGSDALAIRDRKTSRSSAIP